MEPNSRLSILRCEPSPVEPGDLPPQQILILGEATAWLTGWVQDCARRASAGAVRPIDAHWMAVEEALVTLAGAATHAPLVVLAQERPGQLARSLPEKLREASPGIRLLSVAGSWCEGELRTGKPHEEVERIYWCELPSWLAANVADRSDDATRRQLVRVDAVHRETASAIIDTLAAAGHAALWSPRRQAPPLSAGYTAAIWVGGQLNGRHAATLADFCRTMRTAETPMIALLDFPRHDELQVAQQVGAAAVLGMPWTAEDLLGTLDRVTRDALSNSHVQRRLAA